MSTIFELGVALGRLNRWSGKGLFPLSLAQHQTVLSYYVPPRLARAAHIHDVVEFWGGDVPAPFKHKCYDYRRLENWYQGHIFKAFGVPIEDLEAIDEYDHRIRVDEWLAIQPGGKRPPGEPLGALIDEMTPLEASNAWLQRYAALFDSPADGGTPLLLEAA
jgi:hypothetical protein